MTSAPQIDSTTGLLLAARQVLSPHWDTRPRGVLPDLIVVHGISLPPRQFGGPWIDRLFCGNLPASADPSFAAIAQLRVSAHSVICAVHGARLARRRIQLSRPSCMQ